MQFVEEKRRGVILGNKVVADPIPWSAMYGMQRAQTGGDNEKIVEAMADIVARFVHMEDGTPIDAKAVSPRALTELFKFATDDGEEASVSDFTPPPSGGPQETAKA